MWLQWKSSDNMLKIWNSFDVLHSQKVNTFVIFCQSLWLIHTSQPILMCSYCVLRATIYYYIWDILCGKQLYFDILIFWKSEFKIMCFRFDGMMRNVLRTYLPRWLTWNALKNTHRFVSRMYQGGSFSALRPAKFVLALLVNFRNAVLLLLLILP